MYFSTRGTDRERGEKDEDDTAAFGWRSASKGKELSEVRVKSCFHSANVGTEGMRMFSERKACSLDPFRGE